MALSSFAIQNAKPKGKPYKLSDGDGLHLLITDKGTKLWRFRYRFGGKQLMLSLGSYPEVSLASARKKRNDARELIAHSIDPSQKRKSDKAAAALAADDSLPTSSSCTPAGPTSLK